jgi:hypothetical protein
MNILFQPLTLLDCMHTFCGACLKDWFAHQAASARTIHPYTCPSCRDSVRSTKRYPFIMNMLEKHFNKNPDKVRSEEDKQEHLQKYKPGDNVLPKLRLRNPTPDPDDERVMNQVVQLSLIEAGITESAAQPIENTLRPMDNRPRATSRGSRSRTSSRSPGRPSTDTTSTTTTPQATNQVPARQPSDRSRPLEHQSSLISLLSVSEMDPQDMQDEIMRQIVEEGLLDDIDLGNIDASQEEELSERIARAYQRRREETRRRQREGPPASERSRQRDRSSQRPTSSRPSSRSSVREAANPPTERRRTGEARPPISNPQLIDSANQGQIRHRRTGSSNSSRSAVRIDSGLANASSPTLAPILPSVTATTERRRRRSNERSVTDPNRVTGVSRPSHASPPGSAPSTPRIGESTLAPRTTHLRQRSDSNPQRSPRLGSSSTFPRVGQNHSTSSLPIGQHIAAPESSTLSLPAGGTPGAPAMGQRPSPSSSAQSRPKLHTEPSISCNKCHKAHIEYDVHYNCPECSRRKESYNLCKSCFRRGDGCSSWFGFGSAAMREFESLQSSQAQANHSPDKPHIFTAHRYAKPKHPLVPSSTSEQPHRQLTEEDPMKRLEKGVFCDLCSNFANNCYWKCDACNDGEWGYCNSCVNQGKHCTHPLLPLKAREDEQDHTVSGQNDGHLSAPPRPQAEHQPSPPLTPKSASIIDGPVVIPVANLPFQPLTFHTLCDICTIPIPPSVTRYHCPQCNGGDYDICMNCYHGLVSTGKISTTNGPQGWRKCPQSHRMVVMGFQDAGGGQRRVVDRDLVGGWTFVDSDTTTAASRRWRWNDNGQEQAVDPEHQRRLAQHIRAPRDGGIGLVFYGRWNYFPKDASDKDLVFPKGAEIREAEDINGEWLWGFYAGTTGLFPAAYVNFLRRIAI